MTKNVDFLFFRNADTRKMPKIAYINIINQTQFSLTLLASLLAESQKTFLLQEDFSKAHLFQASVTKARPLHAHSHTYTNTLTHTLENSGAFFFLSTFNSKFPVQRSIFLQLLDKFFLTCTETFRQDANASQTFFELVR